MLICIQYRNYRDASKVAKRVFDRHSPHGIYKSTNPGLVYTHRPLAIWAALYEVYMNKGLLRTSH
jgi:hypothetical protein